MKKSASVIQIFLAFFFLSFINQEKLFLFLSKNIFFIFWKR